MTMHLPWKKCSKIARVSRFVSDLRSSKHGGSLVVETGFPTSLIDLVAKNRDRLKKSSSTTKNKKRTNQQQQSDLLEISDNSTPFPPSSSSSQLLSSSNPLNSTTLAIVSSSSPQIKNHPPHRRCKNGERKIPHLAPNQKVEEEEEVVEEVISSISAPNRTFTLIMKLSFLLILAIGTKKLAVAITVLAFFLLFLEFSCSRLFFCFFKPCPNAKKRFNSVVESVVSSVHHHQMDELIEEKEQEQEEGQSTAIISKSSCGSGMFESEEDHNTAFSSNSRSMAKKEEQGSSSSDNKEIQMIESGFDSLHCGCRWGFTENSFSSKRIKNEDLIHENSDIRNQSRRNGSIKFKSKLLKKFVPKKFCQSKKKRNISNNNEDQKEEEHNLDGNSTSDLSNSNSQEEAEDEEKSNRRGEQQDHEDNNRVEKHKNDSNDELQSSGHVSQMEMKTD